MTAPTAREHYLPVSTGRLYARQLGAGRPLVVLHGGPALDHQYLLPEMDALASDFAVTYYAQRGRGASYSGEVPGDVDIRSELADLDLVRAQTGDDPVVLLGHSWGGLLALEYAAAHPHHLTHLVLLNPAPISSAGYEELKREWRTRRTAEQTRVLSALAQDPEYLAGDLAKDAAAGRAHFASTVADSAQLDELIRRCQANFEPESLRAARAIGAKLTAATWGNREYDPLARSRPLAVSTLVITAENDFIPLTVMREIVEAVPGARLEIIEGAGHFPYLERLERLAELITGFAT